MGCVFVMILWPGSVDNMCLEIMYNGMYPFNGLSYFLFLDRFLCFYLERSIHFLDQQIAEYSGRMDDSVYY